MAYQEILTALVDPTRREVFELLRSGPSAVGDLAAQIPVSRPAVSQHLRVLKDARLVRCASEGTRRIYSIDPGGLEELQSYLSTFWGDALEAFKRVAEEEGPSGETVRLDGRDNEHEATREPGGESGETKGRP